MNATVEKEIRDRIRQELAGYRPVREIPEAVLEVLELEDVTKKEVAAMTKEMLEEYTRKQAKWPKVTDYDRLHNAFAELEKQGVVAREDFSCCGNCGTSEMWEELIPQLKKKRKDLRGFVFFNMQGTERAIEGGGLDFDYSGLDRTDAGTVAIGKLLVKTLKEHGLTKTKWNGKPEQRVHVALDWKKRR